MNWSISQLLSVFLSMVLTFQPIILGQQPGQKDAPQPIEHTNVLAIVDGLDKDIQDLLVKDYLVLFEEASNVSEATKAKLAQVGVTLQNNFDRAKSMYSSTNKRLENELATSTEELERLAKSAPPTGASVAKEQKRLNAELKKVAKNLKRAEKELANAKKEAASGNAEAKRKVEHYETQIAGHNGQIAVLQQQLAGLKVYAPGEWSKYEKNRSHELRCRIQSLTGANLENKLRFNKVKTAYYHAETKIALIANWPGDEKEIKDSIANGTDGQRRFGDFDNIGFRVISGKGWKSDLKAQQKSLKVGEEIAEYLKNNKMLKDPVDDKELQAYVREIADHIIANSDIKIPIVVQVVDDDEVNAFAFPGHFYVNKGFMLAAQSEGQLAGVMAHELAHISALHIPRGMAAEQKRSWIMQAIYYGIIFGTGGYGALAMLAYYGLQGVQILLMADMLRISRDYEQEADQLGAQYAWRAGYDPRAFVTTFDLFSRLSKRDPRAGGWFTTHPSDYGRMKAGYGESLYLMASVPEKELKTDSTRFHDLQNKLRAKNEEWKAKKVQDEKNRPSLLKKTPREEGCGDMTGLVPDYWKPGSLDDATTLPKPSETKTETPEKDRLVTTDKWLPPCQTPVYAH